MKTSVTLQLFRVNRHFSHRFLAPFAPASVVSSASHHNPTNFQPFSTSLRTITAPHLLPPQRQRLGSAQLLHTSGHKYLVEGDEQEKPAPLDTGLRQKIEQCVHSSPVVVFMKGTQQEPMCGFSRNVKLVLDLHHVPFKDFNVLEDEQLRQGIKQFSDWPTIPQVYINGEFVGGCDILVQMHKDGEIVQFLDQHGIASRFSEKFPAKQAEATKE